MVRNLEISSRKERIADDLDQEHIERMPWTSPLYSKRRINLAAKSLPVAELWTYERDYALQIVSNWRSSHSYPLQVIKMTLLKRSRQIDAQAIVAQRLKRLPSIELKLSRNKNMQLTQMQDIAGCRAVLSKVSDVEELAAVYRQSDAKNPFGRPELVETYDYLLCPKNDGYRSLHLVYKYRSRAKQNEVYDGLRVEIQLRSKLQHAWATAVETVSTFTGDPLKSKASDMNREWIRFFALMSSAIALRERRQLVPDTPNLKPDLIRELRHYAEGLRVDELLTGWGTAGQWIDTNAVPDAAFFLLTLDSDKRMVNIRSYLKGAESAANTDYLTSEKENENNSQIQTVLVSVDSLTALRAAYPNYYLDTSAFISVLRSVIA
jgi:ppGpp synthetase/RelA/SpoT-type nucleotidyltranferase